MKYGNRNLKYVTLPNSFNGTYLRSKQVMCPCGHLSCGSRAHGQHSISSVMKDIALVLCPRTPDMIPASLLYDVWTCSC